MSFQDLLTAHTSGNHEEITRIMGILCPRNEMSSSPEPTPTPTEEFLTAVDNDDGPTVARLLAEGTVDPSADDNDAICTAARYGYTAVLQHLLTDPRVDPSTDDNYPIRVAVDTNNLAIVKALLADPRVDPTRNEDCMQNNRLLCRASTQGYAEIVDLLLTHPAVTPVPRSMPTHRLWNTLMWCPFSQPIWIADSGGHTDVVHRLLLEPRVLAHCKQYTPFTTTPLRTRIDPHALLALQAKTAWARRRHAVTVWAIAHSLALEVEGA